MKVNFNTNLYSTLRNSSYNTGISNVISSNATDTSSESSSTDSVEINQAAYDAYANSFNANNFPQVISDSLNNLVSNGTISQDQATAIQNALTLNNSNVTYDSNGRPSGGRLEDKLKALVSAGTITQDQETTIENALKPPTDNTTSSALR